MPPVCSHSLHDARSPAKAAGPVCSIKFMGAHRPKIYVVCQEKIVFPFSRSGWQYILTARRIRRFGALTIEERSSRSLCERVTGRQ